MSNLLVKHSDSFSPAKFPTLQERARFVSRTATETRTTRRDEGFAWFGRLVMMSKSQGEVSVDRLSGGFEVVPACVFVFLANYRIELLRLYMDEV